MTAEGSRTEKIFPRVRWTSTFERCNNLGVPSLLEMSIHKNIFGAGVPDNRQKLGQLVSLTSFRGEEEAEEAQARFTLTESRRRHGDGLRFMEATGLCARSAQSKLVNCDSRKRALPTGVWNKPIVDLPVPR